MTSIIRLCPLSGGLADSSEDAFAAHCYLLEVDQFTFLLDCGWDSKFSDDVILELKKHIHKVSTLHRSGFSQGRRLQIICAEHDRILVEDL